MPLEIDYLVREIVTMIPAFTFVYGIGRSSEWIMYSLLGLWMIVIVEIDYRHKVIPNELSGIGAVLGIVYTMLTEPASLLIVLTAALSTMGLMLVIRQGSKLCFGRIGLGMGDVKLVAMIACFIGWESLWIFYLATIFGGLVGLVGILLGISSPSAQIPFAPFIALAIMSSVWLSPLDIILWVL